MVANSDSGSEMVKALSASSFNSLNSDVFSNKDPNIDKIDNKLEALKQSDIVIPEDTEGESMMPVADFSDSFQSSSNGSFVSKSDVVSTENKQSQLEKLKGNLRLDNLPDNEESQSDDSVMLGQTTYKK